MSGLYLIGVVALWLWLSWWILRFGWFAITQTKEKILPRRLLVSVAIIAWFGLAFWYGGGRKYYYDWQVARMCAVDGGIKVYETVQLPTDKFNRWGQINFFNPTKGESALGEAYIYQSETEYIHEESSGLVIIRFHQQVYLRSKNKMLGEQISYVRRGGDMPGLWNPSSFSCPKPYESMFGKLFFKTEMKGHNL